MEKEIKPGIYKHFKTGNLYRVWFVGKHSETLESMVAYQALYNNPESEYWMRPINMFLDEKIDKDGNKVQRFTFVKES